MLFLAGSQLFLFSFFFISFTLVPTFHFTLPLSKAQKVHRSSSFQLDCRGQDLARCCWPQPNPALAVESVIGKVSLKKKRKLI